MPQGAWRLHQRFHLCRILAKYRRKTSLEPEMLGRRRGVLRDSVCVGVMRRAYLLAQFPRAQTTRSQFGASRRWTTLFLRSVRAFDAAPVKACWLGVLLGPRPTADSGPDAVPWIKKIHRRRPINGRAPRVLNSRWARHGHFPAVLSTLHAQSALAAVWRHCPCSMRSGCGLGRCLPRTSYFAGSTHCRPQMAPNPRFSDLFRQTLGSISGEKKNSPQRQSARTRLSARPSQGSRRRRAPQQRRVQCITFGL